MNISTVSKEEDIYLYILSLKEIKSLSFELAKVYGTSFQMAPKALDCSWTYPIFFLQTLF